MSMNGGNDVLSLTYTSDTALQPFKEQRFDPADFLNATLPSWTPASAKQPTSVTLAEISNQTQTLLSQLNAQLAHLSSTLTQLTDDILRSGGRLAYEVEVLRGDTVALNDVLTDGLRNDIEKLVPSVAGMGLLDAPNVKAAVGSPNAEVVTNALDTPSKPDYILKLQTFALVRSRLEVVMKVFDDAINWVLPPSETASQSSIGGLSEPESEADLQKREARGQDFAARIRVEILDLVEGAPGQDGEDALNSADARVEALRNLAMVWKGTVEEKPRMRFVESLARIVQDKRQ